MPATTAEGQGAEDASMRAEQGAQVAQEEELLELLAGRTLPELRLRAEAAGASPALLDSVKDGEGAAEELRAAEELLALIVAFEVWDASDDPRQWDPVGVLQAVRDAVHESERYVALPASIGADEPVLQVPDAPPRPRLRGSAPPASRANAAPALGQVFLPAASMLIAGETERLRSREGQALRVNTVEMELTADWGLTLRVLGKRLSALELRQLCLHAADGHGYVNAMDWSAADGGAPRLLMETAGNELHGPASVAIGLLEHLLKPERVAVCEAIPVAGHPKREALLTDRARHSCTAGLLLGTSAAGGAAVAAVEELLPRWLCNAPINPERQRVIRPAQCARLVHASSRHGAVRGFASRQCAACGHYAAGALRHVADRVLPPEERKQQHAAWTKPGSRRCAHPSPPAPS